MALKALLTEDEHSGLSSELQAEYKKTEDGYRLDVTEVNGWSLDNVEGLKTVLGEVKDERKKLRDFKNRLGDDFDYEDVQARLRELEGMKRGASQREKTAIEAAQRELTEKHSAEIAKRDDRIGVMNNALQTAIIESRGAAAIAKHGGSVDLLLPILMREAFMEEIKEGDETKFVGRLRGDNGIARITKKEGKTNAMDIDEYVESVMMKDQRYAPAFAGSGASGSGSQGGSSGGSGGSGRFRMTTEEARDSGRYRAMKAEAEKAGQSIEITD